MLRFPAALLILLVALTVPRSASAHCDTTRGPVVTAARAALAARDPTLVLHWVRPEDEAAIRTAFQRTMEARALGPAARAVADPYFFETLVRIHRASEGAPYTGLNDRDPEPIIAATDQALKSGSVDGLEQQLTRALEAGLAERFTAARAAQGFRPGDVAAGRLFVADYMSLTHWVEEVLAAAEGRREHHPPTVSHDPSAHPAVHAEGDHAKVEHLPWILTIVFAVAALVEGAFLLRHRRHAAA
jgi:hypothetical protein